MMRERLRRRLAPALLAAAMVCTGCAIQPNDNTLPGQTAVGDDGYTVIVHFDQIENLLPNSTVQKDNVVIGTVASIDTRDWKAIVELRLLRDVELPADAVFSIGQKTLLGAQYVEVVVPPEGETVSARSASSAGGRETLHHGDVVGVDQTGAYPATEQVLGAIALLLNNGGLSQISTITGEMATALNARVPDTRSLIRHSNELLAALDANRAEIVAALESLEELSGGLRADQSELVAAIEEITPGLRVLEEERANLIAAMAKTGRTSHRAVRLIKASESALLANLDASGPILTNLGRASESVPEALKIALTIPFPAMTTRNALRGDYANLFATLDLRGATLAELWSDGLPPAFQANDPVEAPLDSPDRRSEEPAQQPGDGPVSELGGTVDELLGPDPSADETDGSDDEDDCLLATLGVC